MPGFATGMRRIGFRRIFGCALVLWTASCTRDAGVEAEPAATLRAHAGAWERIVAAEDARAVTESQRGILLDGTRSIVPAIRALAVRSLGRLEREDQLVVVASSLHDADPEVRTAAAIATARSARDRDPRLAWRQLREALDIEPEAGPRAALLESLGQLTHASVPDAEETIALLLPHLGDRDPIVRLGAARGLLFLSRQANARSAFEGPALDALRRHATEIPPEDSSAVDSPEAGSSASTSTTATAGGAKADLLRSRRIRVLAAMAFVESGHADVETLAQILDDPAPQVRRVAAAGLATVGRAAAGPAAADSPVEESLLFRRVVERALEDVAGVVRYEGLRVWGSRLAESESCDRVRTAVHDPDTHVALLAIDLVGTACRGDDAVATDAAYLNMRALEPPGDEGDDWHSAAHALVALARLDGELASERLPAFATHPDLFVRTYAAHAAQAAGDTATLRTLASDAHPNVRTAAVRGLHALVGSAARSLYLAQLSEDDSELLQATAAALEESGSGGASGGDAAESLLDALDRITRQERETSRDARRALLVRVGELGTLAHAEHVRPYLRDFDPEIATLASDLLHRWTGVREAPEPRALPPLPIPSFDEAAALASARVVIELSDSAEIELRLFPFDAPTNAARFARLARDGYYDGLTLHRVVPNFVVQGGSPHANEYTGDGPFTRDELARPNWRGTVGLSTRGRDTGDAQLYVNLIDNVRLDTDYTVFAEVVRGMEHVDRLQEGAVMRRVRVHGP